MAEEEEVHQMTPWAVQEQSWSRSNLHFLSVV